MDGFLFFAVKELLEISCITRFKFYIHVVHSMEKETQKFLLRAGVVALKLFTHHSVLSSFKAEMVITFQWYLVGFLYNAFLLVCCLLSNGKLNFFHALPHMRKAKLYLISNLEDQ